MPREKKSKAQVEQSPLTDERRFKAAMKKLVKTTKAQSDAQLAAFQASNKARREDRAKP